MHTYTHTHTYIHTYLRVLCEEKETRNSIGISSILRTLLRMEAYPNLIWFSIRMLKLFGSLILVFNVAVKG